uniref:Peptidase S1 domain-containing protein n=1 Tax=Oryzias sinensis TaxID=183150 RepID=A0A8C7YJT3_9TELE
SENSLTFIRNYNCGEDNTIRWILSAAHCFSSTAGLVVYLGETQINNSPNSVSRTVSQIIVHENYNKQTQDNDISLLKFLSSFFSSRSGSTASSLQEVSVPIVSNSQCSSSYSLTSNMMCAGLTQGGKDSCQVSPAHQHDPQIHSEGPSSPLKRSLTVQRLFDSTWENL